MDIVVQVRVCRRNQLEEELAGVVDEPACEQKDTEIVKSKDSTSAFCTCREPTSLHPSHLSSISLITTAVVVCLDRTWITPSVTLASWISALTWPERKQIGMPLTLAPCF